MRGFMSTEDNNLKELLDLVNNPSTKTDDVTKLDARHIEIRGFIRAKDIKESNNAIHARLIYDAYFQWAKNPISYILFVKYFSNYFKKYRSSSNIFFKIKPESLGLPSYYSMYKDHRFNKKKIKKSRYLGVYPIGGYFIARIKLEDTTHFIGTFEKELDAAIAYDMYAYLHFGRNIELNFPRKWKLYEEELKKEKKE
jgi:hypothetical protein